MEFSDAERTVLADLLERLVAGVDAAVDVGELAGDGRASHHASPTVP